MKSADFLLLTVLRNGAKNGKNMLRRILVALVRIDIFSFKYFPKDCIDLTTKKSRQFVEKAIKQSKSISDNQQLGRKSTLYIFGLNQTTPYFSNTV